MVDEFTKELITRDIYFNYNRHTHYISLDLSKYNCITSEKTNEVIKWLETRSDIKNVRKYGRSKVELYYYGE